MVSFPITLNDLANINDTKHRAASLRQLSFFELAIGTGQTVKNKREATPNFPSLWATIYGVFVICGEILYKYA